MMWATKKKTCQVQRHSFVFSGSPVSPVAGINEPPVGLSRADRWVWLIWRVEPRQGSLRRVLLIEWQPDAQKEVHSAVNWGKAALTRRSRSVKQTGAKSKYVNMKSGLQGHALHVRHDLKKNSRILWDKGERPVTKVLFYCVATQRCHHKVTIIQK